MEVKRIFAGIILIFLVFFAPWWLLCIAAIGGFFFFDLYYEGIIAIFLSDLIYSMPRAPFYDRHFFLTITAVIFFILINILKKRLLPHSYGIL